MTCTIQPEEHIELATFLTSDRIGSRQKWLCPTSAAQSSTILWLIQALGFYYSEWALGNWRCGRLVVECGVDPLNKVIPLRIQSSPKESHERWSYPHHLSFKQSWIWAGRNFRSGFKRRSFKRGRKKKKTKKKKKEKKSWSDRRIANSAVPIHFETRELSFEAWDVQIFWLRPGISF